VTDDTVKILSQAIDTFDKKYGKTSFAQSIPNEIAVLRIRLLGV